MPEWRNGRRGGLKNRCRKTCEFDSRLGHHSEFESRLLRKSAFNMSRTLSIGKIGPGPSLSLESGPFLYIHSRCGDFGVSFRRSSLQFNIRPWRSLAGQSVATAGATSSIRQSADADGAFGARKKGDWDSPQRPRIEPRREKMALYVFVGSSAPYRAPSAVKPTAQHQHASSRAVATFALFLWTPRSSRAARLPTSRRTPFDACRLVLASIHFSPFRPTHFHQLRHRCFADRATADAPLPASPCPPSRRRPRETRPSGGRTARLSL